MSTTIMEANGTAARLRYKGVFDFDGLSTFIITWLKKRQFQINEKKHKHKMSCPFGFEIEWAIDAFRKIDDYYKYNMGIEIYVFDAHQVDAVKDGKKVKLWNARLEIVTTFKVELDYQGKWETSPWLKRLRDNVYHQYIIKKTIIGGHADPLYYKALELHTEMKKFIGMETTNYR